MTSPLSYAVAIDSDGCVFDNMTLKHRRCFGPALIEVWQLGAVQPAAQSAWDKINLFSASRGINRFLALLTFWQTFPAAQLPVGFTRPDTTAMEALVRAHASISAKEINAALAKTPDAFLQQALQWSTRVNQLVASEDVAPPPFAGALRFITEVARDAEVYVVSSANRETIVAEWQHAGLDPSVTDYVTQEICSKSECLRRLKSEGKSVLMIGDSPGDWHAARDNRLPFYPITPGAEDASWDALCHTLETSGAAAVVREHPQALADYIAKLGLAAD